MCQNTYIVARVVVVTGWADVCRSRSSSFQRELRHSASVTSDTRAMKESLEHVRFLVSTGPPNASATRLDL